jgi:hypothetical protein
MKSANFCNMLTQMFRLCRLIELWDAGQYIAMTINELRDEKRKNMHFFIHDVECRLTRIWLES